MMPGKEKENARQFPAAYYGLHMIPGVVGYGDDERIMVDHDAIKKMMGSMAGKPVYVNHQNVDLDKLGEQADGFVFDMFYNEADGGYWSRFTVHTDEAHQAIANGWTLSNCYLPTEYGSGGEHLAVDYQKKLLNGEFKHLAIVSNPRYEVAKILTPDEFRDYNEKKKRELSELQNENDKPKKGNPMLKLFRKTESKTEITNESDVKDSDIVEFDGKEFTVAEFKELMNGKKKKNEAEDADKEAKEKEEKENAEKEEEFMNAKHNVDGEEVTMKDLMECWKNSKKNKKNESAEEKEKENAKAAAAASANRNFFDELKNANAKKSVTIIETSDDRLARGKANY